ncbi:MAG: hypothetical protein WA902_13535 [Thermosynechococcaceae cyanobacterium]
MGDAQDQEKCIEEALKAAQARLDEQQGAFGNTNWIDRWRQRLTEAVEIFNPEDLNLAGLARRVAAAQYSVLNPVYESIVYGLLTAMLSGYLYDE